MADKPLPWFRAYHEAAFDPKIEIAAAQTGLHSLMVFGAWWKILCLAGASPVRGALNVTVSKHFSSKDISKILLLEEKECNDLLNVFIDLDMLETDKNKAYRIKNWDKRQFDSDDSSERVRRYRENRKKNGMPTGGTYNTDTVCNRDSNACVYCGSTENLVVDHVYPISKGGTDDYDNLACACKKCNSGKSGRTPEESGYKFINPEAKKRYSKYLSRLVTVTVTPPDTDTESDTDAEKKSAKNAPPQKARGNPALYNLAVALSEVCRMDLEANKGRLMREAGILSKANPPATPELLKEHYNGSENSYWQSQDWRGKKGQHPTPANVRETWGKWTAADGVVGRQFENWTPEMVAAENRRLNPKGLKGNQ